MTSEKPLSADLASHLGRVWIRPRHNRSAVLVSCSDGLDGSLDRAVSFDEVPRWCEFYALQGLKPKSPQFSYYKRQAARERVDARREGRTPSEWATYDKLIEAT